MKCPKCDYEAYEDQFEERDGTLICPECNTKLMMVEERLHKRGRYAVFELRKQKVEKPQPNPSIRYTTPKLPEWQVYLIGIVCGMMLGVLLVGFIVLAKHMIV